MKLSFKQSLIIIFLIITPLVASMLPFTIQSIKSPPDRVFMGLHRWSEDYYGYLHTINQGLMGHLHNINKITLEPHQPTFIHSEYAFLGLIGRIFGLNSVMTYHLSRLIIGAIFLMVAFYFFYYIFRLTKNQKPIANSYIAFFLAFFIGGFPDLSAIIHYPLSISSYLPWWVELDVTRRSTILPHYLMGSILFLLTIIFFLKNLKFNTLIPKYLNTLIPLFLTSFLLSFVHPIDFLILISTIGLFILFRFLHLSFRIWSLFEIWNLRFEILKTLQPLIISFFTILLSGLLPILYYRYSFTLPFWRFIFAHGTTTKYNIPLFDFVMALGPVFFLALGGIFLIVMKATGDGASLVRVFFDFFQKKLLARRAPAGPVLLLFSWLFVQAAFFLKLYEIFNFDRLRAMQAPHYIPLAFFAVLFLKRIYTLIPKYLNTLILILIFTPPLFLSYQSLKKQIHEVSDFKSFSSFTYPSRKQYESWVFLRNHTLENSVITTLYEARFLLPAVAGNKIAFGANFDNDPDYGKNLSLIAQIYQSTLNPLNTLNFLKNNRISYLYFGFQEKSLGGDLTKYDFLTKIFDNGEVAIFAVKPRSFLPNVVK